MTSMILKFDSCSLIYIVKTDLFAAIHRYYGTIKITTGVKKECVDNGKQHGHRDAYVIEDLIGKGKIEVVAPDDLSTKVLSHSLGIGETETILEAELEGCYAVLNDQKSRICASQHGVKNITVEIILLELLSLDELDGVEFDKNVRMLATVSWMRAERMAELFKLKRMIQDLKGTRSESDEGKGKK